MKIENHLFYYPGNNSDKPPVGTAKPYCAASYSMNSVTPTAPYFCMNSSILSFTSSLNSKSSGSPSCSILL